MYGRQRCCRLAVAQFLRAYPNFPPQAVKALLAEQSELLSSRPQPHHQSQGQGAGQAAAQLTSQLRKLWLPPGSGPPGKRDSAQ